MELSTEFYFLQLTVCSDGLCALPRLIFLQGLGDGISNLRGWNDARTSSEKTLNKLTHRKNNSHFSVTPKIYWHVVWFCCSKSNFRLKHWATDCKIDSTSRTHHFVTHTHTDTLLYRATETLTVGVGAVVQSSTAEARSRQCSGWSMAGWWTDRLTEDPGVHTWPPPPQASYNSSCNPITPSLHHPRYASSMAHVSRWTLDQLVLSPTWGAILNPLHTDSSSAG